MRLHMRLRFQKRKIFINSIIFVWCILIYLLIKHRASILSPDIFANVPNYLTNVEHKQNQFKMPGSFIERNVHSNISYCNFNYNLPTALKYQDSDLYFSPQLGQTGTYRILYNVVESIVNDSTSITYCTHLTPNFVYFLAEIIRYWETAISVAAFVPDIDAGITIQLLTHLCHCVPGMNRVSVHFVFPEKRPPFVLHSDLKPKCLVPDVTDLETFRNRENLPYPINVCRNVARNAAKTSFVLVSDIELIPSRNLASKFTKMLEDIRFMKITPYQVFVVPVFEIESGEKLPRTKEELKMLFDKEKAVYFHRWVCRHCQKFPGLMKWLNIPSKGNIIKPFIAAKREYPYHRWEPVYIGTNKDPFYSETLSWEGQQDKMTQMVEMCLMGYRFIILDGAFLVHWPGIKRRTKDLKNQNEWRKPHQKQNTKQYDVIINYLASKYTENDRCKLQ